MKKIIKEEMLAFMESTETGEMSSNEFVWEFIKSKGVIHNEIIVKSNFIFMPSVESITRTRRYIQNNHGIGKRTKADTEQEYIDEYARANKYNKDD